MAHTMKSASYRNLGPLSSLPALDTHTILVSFPYLRSGALAGGIAIHCSLEAASAFIPTRSLIAALFPLRADTQQSILGYHAWRHR